MENKLANDLVVSSVRYYETKNGVGYECKTQFGSIWNDGHGGDTYFIKKERVLKENETLSCEVCGFDFVEVYGDHGYGFIECHHTKPVSELMVGERTKISDLSLVCSNCHRMIHKKRPWLSVKELKDVIR